VYEPQSGVVPQSGEATLIQPDGDRNEDEDRPMQTESMSHMAAPVPFSDDTQKVFFGDPITSFRQMLKRYTLHSVHVPNNIGEYVFYIRQNDLPYFWGYDPNGIHNSALPADPTPFNYVKPTLLNWLLPAFTGWKGSLRWKVIASHGIQGRGGLLSVTRVNPGSTTSYDRVTFAISQVDTSTNNERTLEYIEASSLGFAGTFVTPQQANPVLEYELPFYDNRRFLPSKRTDSLAINDVFGHAHELRFEMRAQPIDMPHVTCYVSTGEDFNLGFFTGCPIMFRETSYPAASTTVNGL
jgi:hypothetical protein